MSRSRPFGTFGPPEQTYFLAVSPLLSLTRILTVTRGSLLLTGRTTITTMTVMHGICTRNINR